VPRHPDVVSMLVAGGSWMIVGTCLRCSTRDTDPQLSPSALIGADVTHPGPGLFEPSIASIVTSMNPEHTRYTTFFSVQSPRLEIIEELRSMMKAREPSRCPSFATQTLLQNAFKSWFRVRGPFPPRHVIFYRDGVSEGEYGKVKDHEVSAIRCRLTTAIERTSLTDGLILTRCI
jgi:hypothetical protein